MRSQLFLKTLNCLKYGKNDQRVTPEPLMRKHKTGSAKHGGIVQIAHQRWWYEVVAVRRESECPTETEVGTRFDLSNPHKPSHDLYHVLAFRTLLY